MARMSFGNKAGRIRSTAVDQRAQPAKTVDEVLREIKKGQEKPAGEDYRERSLSIHGLICARCGREFAGANRHLLTVHHKDLNHHNNPPDGSNWENLCVYCHDDVHSRAVLGEYVEGESTERGARLVYEDRAETNEVEGSGLAEALQKALREKAKKG